jgi:hypothetical protein
VRSLGNGNTFSGVTYSPSLNTFVAVGFNPVSGNVEGGYTMTMSVSALTDTPFVARFNSSGSLVATKFYETSPGRPAGMEIIGNQLYLAGTIVVGAAPDYDGYLMAMNADDFSTQWIVQMTAGTTTDIISAMDIDQANGVIFLTGLTNGALDGQTNKGGGDALISRRNLANGTLISTLQIGSSANDQGNNIVLDPYRPVVYVAGNAGGTINSVPLMYNAQDQWISAYTANNLTHLWTKIVGGSGTIENAFDVSVHPLTQNIYLSGAISALISGVPNVQPIYSGARDLTVAVFRPNGTFVWLKVAGSTADDFAYGSAFTDNGALLIAAQFNGTSGLLIYGADANSSYVPPANPFARPGIPVTSQVCYSTLATVLATQSQCTATSTVSATLTSTQRLTSTLTLLACTSTQTLILRETTCTATQFVTATVSQTAPVTVSQCAQLVTQSVIANAVSTVTITQAASLLSCSTQQTILVNGQIAQPNSEALKTVTATETVFVTSVAGKSDNNDISNYSSVDTMIIAVGVGFSVLLIAIVSFFVYQKNWNSKIGKMTSRYPAYSTRENFFGGYSAMKEDVNAMGRISRDFERPFLKLNSAVEREVDETGVVDNTQKLQFFEDTQKNNIVTDVQVNGPKSQAYLETKTV